MRLAVIPGDGIGPEVIAEALKVLGEVKPGADIVRYDLGAARWHATGELLPESVLSELREFDYEIFATKPTDTDVLVAATVNLATGATVALEGINGLFGDVDSNVFDTNVVMLPVRLVDLGIDPNADTARLSYSVGVAGYYAASDGLVDFVPEPMSFDPLKPGLWVQGGGDPALSYASWPGTALVVHRDAAALELDGSDSLLILNHHNATGDRASVVKVSGPAPTNPSFARQRF